MRLPKLQDDDKEAKKLRSEELPESWDVKGVVRITALILWDTQRDWIKYLV